MILAQIDPNHEAGHFSQPKAGGENLIDFPDYFQALDIRRLIGNMLQIIDRGPVLSIDDRICRSAIVHAGRADRHVRS
jgi:hypothetical protein